MLAAWAGSAVPRNSGWTEPEQGVEIMVESNGVHTALVLPLVTAEKDWRVAFPPSVLPEADRPYTHISVGWGEREVFLNTPTWADLSPITVLRIIGAGGDGLLHLAYYVHPAPDGDMRPLRITREQYARLAASIEKLAPGPMVSRYRGYDANDVFYDAPGRYTAANTCNQWTSDMLAAAGVRTGWWTPFAGGVMKWVPPLGS
jgi:uncharacterized protein (TIGR02117 family)